MRLDRGLSLCVLQSAQSYFFFRGFLSSPVRCIFNTILLPNTYTTLQEVAEEAQELAAKSQNESTQLQEELKEARQAVAKLQDHLRNEKAYAQSLREVRRFLTYLSSIL